MRMRKKKNLEERLTTVSDLLFISEMENRNFSTAAEEKEYIDFDAWYAKKQPLYLEIGCGKGKFACEYAKKNPNINYKFIGMGNRTEEFLNTYNGNSVSNVEFIPFLNKEDLAEEYKNCSLFVLPSRQECWGLVINEAASFGTPIVSTYGSGAAMEFLAEDYPQFLAKPNDADELFYCIELALSYDKIEDYSKFLKEKSKRYTIENGVAAIIRACNL